MRVVGMSITMMVVMITARTIVVVRRIRDVPRIVSVIAVRVIMSHVSDMITMVVRVMYFLTSGSHYPVRAVVDGRWFSGVCVDIVF